MAAHSTAAGSGLLAGIGVLLLRGRRSHEDWSSLSAGHVRSFRPEGDVLRRSTVFLRTRHTTTPGSPVIDYTSWTGSRTSPPPRMAHRSSLQAPARLLWPIAVAIHRLGSR